MSIIGKRMGPGTAIAVLVLCILMQTGIAAQTIKITDAGAFLDQTEALRNQDHLRFAQQLERIHRESPALTTAQQWHLRYLDALEASLEGKFTTAEQPLRDVINRSRDPILAAKASALLMNNLALAHRYQDAFVLANRLTIDLPTIQDKPARFQVLGYLSQMLNLAGQTDLATKYAHMMGETIPAGMDSCYPRAMLVAALWNAKQLSSSDPDLRKAVDVCEKARKPIVANTVQLTLSSRYLEERKPEKALALLKQIEPSIRINHYYPHTLSAQTQRAEAYEQLGQLDDARKAALAAIAMASPDEINDYLAVAYEVLYRISKRQGDPGAALRYYENYVAQNKGSIDDAAAQALAYQTIQQRVLTRKLETEELSKKNSILTLQQALDTKAAETSRIYITLLIILLSAIMLWLFRTTRLQMRFKHLASHDGLTGILNHQHFMSEAERILRLSEKKLVNVSLISIDLDHFKQVNDTYGHAMGDEVLRQAVQVCKSQLRASDVFGRLGGEEFGILLQDCSRDHAKSIAHCIRKAISEAAIERNDVTVRISTSVGLACTTSSGYGLRRLCTDADAALYRAKRGGRNRVIADIEDGYLASA